MYCKQFKGEKWSGHKMNFKNELKPEEEWLLAIIGSTPYVQGDTRLQKYGVIVAREILDKNEFFNDWKPDNFGGYSKQLAICTKKLQKEQFIKANEIINEYNKPVVRYAITEKARSVIERLGNTKLEKLLKIKEITKYYFDKKLKELLADVYNMYPDLISKSTIRAEVNIAQTEKNSFLSTEYEIPFDAKAEIQNILATAQVSDFVFNDEEFRMKLAKSIGLEKAPRLDPEAFERLSGILSKRIKSKKIDSVELVKSVRGS